MEKEKILKKGESIAISVLLLVTVFVTLFVPSVSAAGDPVILHMEVTNESIKVGETITFTQYVEAGTIDNDDITNLGIEYVFNATALQVDGGSFSWGSFSPGSEMYSIPNFYNDDSVPPTAPDYADPGEGSVIQGGCDGLTGATGDNGNFTLWSFEFTGNAPGTGYIEYVIYEPYDSPTVTSFGAVECDWVLTGNTTIDVRYGDEPVIESVSPMNETGETPHNHPDITATLQDGDGDTLDWWINTTPDVGSNSGTGVSPGSSISCPLQNELSYDTHYDYTIEVSDGHYHTSESYYFETRPQHTVTPPTGFGATATNKNTIQITWSSKGENSTDVWVEAQQGSYPASRGSGDEHWNVTEGFNHDGLNPEEDWYYRAWSYDDVDNVWSATPSEDTDTTPANTPITFSGATPGNETNIQYIPSSISVDIDDPEDSVSSWDIETTPDIGSTAGSGEGTKSAAVSLGYGDTCRWYVNATDDEALTSRAWYEFDITQPPTVDSGSFTIPDGSTLDPGVTAAWWNVSVTDPESDPYHWSLQLDSGTPVTGTEADDIAMECTGLTYGQTYDVTLIVQNSAETYTFIDNTYTFSTEDDLDPRAHHPNPANGTSGLSTGSLTWNCTLEDYEDTDQIGQWNIDCSNGQSNGGVDFNYGPTNVSVSLTGLTDGTYTIWVNTTTGTWRPAGIFYFTVGGGPNNPVSLGTPSPTNGSIDQDLVFQWIIPIDDDEDDDVSYSIECSNGQTGSDTATSFPADGQLSLTGLAYSTSYTIWVNATDAGNGTTVREWFTFDTKDNVAPTIGTPTPGDGAVNQSNEIDWEVLISDTLSGSTEDDDLDWEIECSDGNRTEGNDDAYGTKTLSLSDLSPDTWYTIWVNVSDGSLTANETFTFHVVDNVPPTISSPDPAHEASDISIEKGSVDAIIDDADGDGVEYTIEGTFITDVDASGDGTVTATIQDTLLFDTTYTWYVNATDPAGSGQTTSEIYTFTTESFMPPTGFTATTVNRTAIELEWTNNEYAEITAIHQQKDGESTWEEIFNESVTGGATQTYSVQSLDVDTTYYYRAWSYDAGEDMPSPTYAACNTTTDPNYAPVIHIYPGNGETSVTTVLGGKIEHTDDNDDALDITITLIEPGEDPIILRDIEQVSDTDSMFSSDFLNYSKTYTIWVNATDGYVWTNESSTFTTGEQTVIGNITLYYNNDTKTGYNFVTMIEENADTSGLAQVLDEENITGIDYIVEWDPEEQKYGQSYNYGYPGSVDLSFEAGDVALINVNENITMPWTRGYAPTMEWQDIPLKTGYNYIGRTNETISAFDLGNELLADIDNSTLTSADVSVIQSWDAIQQDWSDHCIVEYINATVAFDDFPVAPGDVVLVTMPRSDSFSMYGW